MKISEIPYPKVKAAAEKNRKFPGDYLPGAFEWVKSPEGHRFWTCVNKGWWKDAKEICPHLFEEEKPVLGYHYDTYVAGHWYSVVSVKKPDPTEFTRNLAELVAK